MRAASDVPYWFLVSRTSIHRISCQEWYDHARCPGRWLFRPPRPWSSSGTPGRNRDRRARPTRPAASRSPRRRTERRCRPVHRPPRDPASRIFPPEAQLVHGRNAISPAFETPLCECGIFDREGGIGDPAPVSTPSELAKRNGRRPRGSVLSKGGAAGGFRGRRLPRLSSTGFGRRSPRADEAGWGPRLPA
jgi:hypothetical protein